MLFFLLIQTKTCSNTPKILIDFLIINISLLIICMYVKKRKYMPTKCIKLGSFVGNMEVTIKMDKMHQVNAKKIILIYRKKIT